jgi:hypothetical protein
MKMIVFGIACCAFVFGSLFWYYNTTNDWPETQARVTSVNNGMSTRHLVQWQYTVDNQTYTGYEYVDGLTPDLKVGQMISIKHSKKDAGISVAPTLQKTSGQSTLAAIALGAALALVIGCLRRFQKI